MISNILKIKEQLQLPLQFKKIYKNLYFHIPFCRNKCAYCAFFSVTDFSEELLEKYVDRLIEQIKVVKDYCLPLHSIYIGGGTPTLLPEKLLTKFFVVIHDYLPLDHNCEISIESNPETVTAEKIAVISKYCTRLSLGIQSFDAKMRKVIGRGCSDEAIDNALNLIQNSSLKNNFNIDLIYGIPSQKLNMWENDLQQALTYNISHISCYSLTIDEGAQLAELNAIANNIDDDFAVDCAESTKKILQKNKFNQYEISNYCTEKKYCQHNLNIWHGESYLGIGATASSFNLQENRRFNQISDIDGYLNFHDPEIDIISEKDRLIEIFVMGLRTNDGWSKDLWETIIAEDKRYCNILSWAELKKFISQKISSNNFKIYYINGDDNNNEKIAECDIIIGENMIKLTVRGLNFWDSIAVILL